MNQNQRRQQITNLFRNAFRDGGSDLPCPETDSHPADDLEFLERLENGVVPQDERAGFLRHLETCPFCRHEIAFFLRSGILFPDAENSSDTPSETLSSANFPPKTVRKTGRFSSRGILALLTSAAVLALVLLAGQLGILTHHSNNHPVMIGTLGTESGEDSERERAEQGDAKAQTGLGVRHYSGIAETDNGKPDYAEAVKWFRQAAEQGNPEAQDWLGLCYAEGHGIGQNFAESAKWIRRAAGQGYAPAQFRLGELYAEGRGVEKDPAAAAGWFCRAAEQGYPDAQYRLGLCYAEGLGVGQDLAEAAGLFRKAAEQGSAPAQFQLGLMYAEGEGAAQNADEAVYWLQMSIDTDPDAAKQAIGKLENEGRPLPPEILSRLFFD